MEGTLNLHGLLSHYCLAFHGTDPPNTYSATPDFGLVRPAEGEWVTVLLQEIFRYDYPPYDVDFGTCVYQSPYWKNMVFYHDIHSDL